MNHFQGILPAVRDQGERHTCLSIALSDGHLVARNAGPHLSPEYLHFHSAKRCGAGINDPVTLNAGRDALRVDGQPEDNACPYSPSWRPQGWNLPIVRLPIWHHATRLGSGSAKTTVKKCLKAGSAAGLILRINDAFVRGASAANAIDDIRGADRGYHAVLAVGAGSKPARTLIRNCWGESWSDMGYAWITDRYLSARCTDVVIFSGAIT